MIAVESFKRFRKVDIILLIVLAGLYAVLSFLFNQVFLFKNSYIYSILVMSILVGLSVFMLKRAGVAVLFYIFAGLFSFYVDDVGVMGWDKLMVFVAAGLIFEVMFLVLKLEVRNVPLDVILSMSTAVAVIPFGIFFLFADLSDVVMNVFMLALNMALLSFFVGLIGGVCAFLVWYRVRTTRWILRFNYSY